MTETEQRILQAVAQRESALASMTPPPQWKAWEFYPWQEEMEFGPRYSPSAWFGEMPNHIRQRYLRSIYELEKQGFLIATKTEGGKLAFLKLSIQGQQAIKCIATESDKLHIWHFLIYYFYGLAVGE